MQGVAVLVLAIPFASYSNLASLFNDVPAEVAVIDTSNYYPFRLSRLNAADWERLKDEIRLRRVRVVALDLPTSWAMASEKTDEFTRRMHEALNGMMLDMIAAIARKDYDDRRRRQAQGIAKAKAEGRYRGRPEDTQRNSAIQKMLKSGQSWSSIVSATGASRSTLARLAKRA